MVWLLAALRAASPLAWLKALAALAAALMLAWLAAALIDHGRLVERDKRARASEVNQNAADAAERRVLECPPGMWNRQLRKCEKEATR